jgi:Fic family protein
MNLSFGLTQELTVLLRELDNAFSKAYAFIKSAPQEELEALHRYARVSTIGASTRIENALLTDSEVNWIDTILTADGKTTAFKKHEHIITNKLSKDRERSIEEVAGCRSMLLSIYQNYRDFYPLKAVDIRGLHYDLLAPYKNAVNYAGKYKVQSNSVVEVDHETNQSRTVFKTADPGPITETAMNDLITWYNDELLINPWPIAVAAEFVFRFLAIHPFQDGNGRLGRGLFLLTLLNSKHETIESVSKYLAIDRFIERSKEEYYYVLNKCSEGIYRQDSKEYEVYYFLKYMIKILKNSLENLTYFKDRYRIETNLSESAAKVLTCFRNYPEIRLTTKKIVDITGLERRTVIRSLNLLTESQLIQKYGQGPSTRYQITF